MPDAPAPEGPPPHPLAMLSAGEIRAAREIVEASGRLGDDVRYVSVLPEEPPKAELIGSAQGSPSGRRLRVQLLDRSRGESYEAVVSLTRGTVESWRAVDPRAEGHLPILTEEFEAVQALLDADEGWRAALARRGLSAETVLVVSLSAGHYGPGPPSGHRLLRGLGFHLPHAGDQPWAHPVDGLVACVDLTAGRVVEVVDDLPVPVPREPGGFGESADTGPPRTTLRPIRVTQPEGVSFTVDAGHVRWENWSLRLGFNVREGLTLHDLRFHDRDRGRERSVVHRASIAEMVVPYADPSPTRSRHNYFDQGEYLFGRYTNSLARGCDCLGEIHYLDAVVADKHGDPRTVPNAVCLHEEDQGVLWKHTDLFLGVRETRRQRRLVLSYFTSIGNYDYGFYWYLYLDGTLAHEVKATGIVFTSGWREEGSEYAAEVAPGLGAPYHQHLFSARLDMAVDGHRNAVDELDMVRVPMSRTNPHGNAFTRRATRLRSELKARRLADGRRDRVWRVSNPDSPNRLGHPVAYDLVPEERPTLLADDASPIASRAAFATRHLWVTRHSDEERYPAGHLVNQHPGGAGLPAWTAADRDLDGADLVLWHTFGLTHCPRTEDWPVMPADRAGFTLRPAGFFDRNPTLDVPRPDRAAQESGTDGGPACH